MFDLKLTYRSRSASIMLALSLLTSVFFVADASAQTGSKNGGTNPTPDPISAGALPDAQDAPLTCAPPFSDVHTSDFYFDSVRYLFCSGAIGGYSDNTFRPGSPTSRGQFSKIIVMAMGWPLLNPSSPTFNDVLPGSPFYTYVETAASHGIISGYGNGSFGPGDPVSRGQLVKMVVLSEGWALVNPSSPTFSDVRPGSPFYAYVETATAHGVIEGYPDGTFKPSAGTTRGQVSKVIYYARTSAITSLEQQTMDLINARRVAMGLVALRYDAALHRATLRHVNDIGPQGLCQHDGTDGSSPWDRASEAGYTGFAMGEVVGCGYPTPQAIVDGWWNSPGHYAVLTSPDARAIGCAWWVNSAGYGWQACLTGNP